MRKWKEIGKYSCICNADIAAEEKRRETNNDYWFCGGIELYEVK